MRTTLSRINPVNEWAVEAAVTHPVFAELFEEIVDAPREEDPAVAVCSLSGPARRLLPRRALLTGAAAVVVLLGVLAGTGASEEPERAA